MTEEATLEIGEFHPMALYALKYIRSNVTPMDVETLASCALAGNRTADICLSTWNRLEKGEPVSDRYLMGLAWFAHQLREQDAAMGELTRLGQEMGGYDA